MYYNGQVMNVDQIRSECESDVSRPGKFEGCASYVPYFWSIYLDGGADRDDGTVLGFDVSADDKKIFPELKRRRTVRLMETDSGFVIEV